jgi:hypothetical protein
LENQWQTVALTRSKTVTISLGPNIKLDAANELLNYKGIYAENNEDEQKYTCPITGAHFEFNEMCKRMRN